MTPQSICQYNIVLQSQSFLKKIENFLCKQKLVNNHSIPSMHADRKITICFRNTLLFHIPLLALTQPQMELQRNKYTCCASAGGTFFQLCCCVSFLISGGKQFQVLLTYHTSCAVVSFFCCSRKQFWVAQISFLVVVGNSFRCYLLTSSEVQNKMIIMGHQILSCHVPVVRSFFIL